MRFNELTNMSKKEAEIAEALLYIDRCTKAVAKIPQPEGIEIVLQAVYTKAKSKKTIEKALELNAILLKQIGQVELSMDRASRKRTKVK